ncbi:MAG: hypothetical protein RLZ98_1820 [Pseudomonadota bacterium]|jgi:hypothetical protein
MLFRYLFSDMQVSYTAYEPPDGPVDRVERAAKVEFIKDGFSLMAALLPPVWLFSHNLWLELVAYIGAALAVLVALEVAGVGADWQLIILLALHIWFGFEAASVRRWNLERQGWRRLGAVTGSSLLDCERRFFDAWLSGEAGGDHS